jgi:hypothetical protein
MAYLAARRTYINMPEVFARNRDLTNNGTFPARALIRNRICLTLPLDPHGCNH